MAANAPFPKLTGSWHLGDTNSGQDYPNYHPSAFGVIAKRPKINQEHVGSLGTISRE